ncbi:MAG: hypothetical protein IT376_21710 [Polyangiaceae bacterium]|nr:hypothetical protein [Polyangiaceae bacterium]
MADYRHRQLGWVILGSLGGAAVALSVPLALAGYGAIASAVGSLLAVTAALFASLTVTVDDRELRFWFGPGLIGKTLPLALIRSWRPVESSWLLGWGVRIYRRGVLYNVSGLRAVEIVLRDGTELRIGTDEPEALAAALRARLGDPPPPTQAEIELTAGRARRWLTLVIALALVSALGVGGLLFGESRPPVAEVDQAGLHVSSLVYSAHVRPEEVVRVELVDRLPPIELRTNGTALGARLRGHFRLREWGDGKLFLDADRPPFLFVQTRDGYVVYGASEPNETRRVEQELRARLGR